MADPTLPQLTMSTTDPLSAIERTVDCSSTNVSLTTSTLRKNAFIAALADAQFKDYIITEPNETYDGQFTLKAPATSGLGATSGYVVVRPRGFDSNVAIGERAVPADVTYMTTLRCNVSSDGVKSDQTIIIPATGGTSYWWISGLQVVPAVSKIAAGAIVYFSAPSDASNPSNQCDHMMVDRCYVHGDDTLTAAGGETAIQGVIGAGTYIGVIHSTIDDIKTAFETTGNDCQAFYGSYGGGPFHLENNVLRATCENTLFETPGGEYVDVTVAANGTTVTTADEFRYDIASIGATMGVSGGSNTPTVASVDSVTQITLATALTGVSLPFTGRAYFAMTHAASYYPHDITIKRNYYSKKAAWNIHDPAFDMNTGSESGLNNMTIHASDNTKLVAGTFSHINDPSNGNGTTIIYITGGTGFITGRAICTSFDGSGNAVFDRVLGTVGSTGGTARRGYSCKNLIEFKSGNQILIEGNVFDTDWTGGGQTFALAFAPRYRAPIHDITFQYNKVTNVYALMQINASNSAGVEHDIQPPYPQLSRAVFKHNLFENIRCGPSSAYFVPGATEYFIYWLIYDQTGTVNGVSGGATTMDDFVFEHNTLAGTNCMLGSTGPIIMMGRSGDTAANLTKAKRFVWRNNIIFADTGQEFDSGIASGGGATFSLDTFTLNSTADARTVTKNVYFDTAHSGSDFTASVDLGNAFETTANRANVGFTNYAGGNYALTGAGTYRNWATDGTDPGADFTELNARIAGAITGVWDDEAGSSSPLVGLLAMSGSGSVLGFGVRPQTP